MSSYVCNGGIGFKRIATAAQISKMLKRLRRSPQEQREDLPKCKSAFVNFPKFKLRGCPPPKFCSLSRPLKKRYCVRENSPKFAFPK